MTILLQGTMPSTAKKPSRIPMWRGVKFAYLIIAMCLFPLAIGGYSAYGNLVRAKPTPSLLSLFTFLLFL